MSDKNQPRLTTEYYDPMAMPADPALIDELISDPDSDTSGGAGHQNDNQGQEKAPRPKKKPKQEDPELARMNAEIAVLMGTPVKQGKGPKRRTESQMNALKRERRRRRISVPLILLCVLLVLVAGGFGTYRYLLSSGRKSLLAHKQIEGIDITAPEDAIVEDDGQKVTYNGKTYRRNEDIVSLLFLGVDVKSEDPGEREIGNNGQADTIFIGALNTVTGKMDIINISRESIVDVDTYDTNGDYAGTEPMQICLAYAYGDGEQTSCENTAKSVSRLMYGMPIDSYASITVPAISVLNDAIGGVEVTVLDDLGSGDNKLVKGERVTLKGKQVNTYVISRDQYSAEANNNRMARQRQYLIAFMNKAFSQIRSDLTTVFTLYEAVTNYMSTDLTVAKMTYLANLAMNGMFREQDIKTVPGEITLETGIDGEEHANYHVDDKELYNIILDVYYEEV